MPDFSLSLISTVDLSTARTPSTEAHMALAWTADPRARRPSARLPSWEPAPGPRARSWPPGRRPAAVTHQIAMRGSWLTLPGDQALQFAVFAGLLALTRAAPGAPR